MNGVQVRGAVALAAAIAMLPIPSWSAAARPAEVLKLPDGRTASVYANGQIEILSKDGKQIEFRRVSLGSNLHDIVPNPGLPGRQRLIASLMKPRYRQPYFSGRVVVVFRSGSQPSQDVVSVPMTTLLALRKQKTLTIVPRYTNDAQLNRTLATIGTRHVERLFRRIDRSTLSAMHAAAQARVSHPLLDISNAYEIDITNASVRGAIARLLQFPDVAYASPDWRVGPMHADPMPLSTTDLNRAHLQAQRMQMRSMTTTPGLFAEASFVPKNYALASSMQSLHNAPGADSAAAFDEIWAKFHQLPGEGETITNVSLGDLDDASAAANTSDPCWLDVVAFGPTTETVGSQRYINWPSMPLIPTYTADDSGNLDGQGEVCGVDPSLDEIGLDFSMMAPLPDQDQRAGETGSGPTDLLGIAPGASYRLIVPSSNQPTMTDVEGALLGAALQRPRTNVITASLGYGFDTEGFSGRFLEDDPLTQALVASIVNSESVVVCISAGDGIRAFTDTAIGPSGGAAPTNIAAPGAPTTDLNDIAMSGYPSQDYDSGSIDAGGATLDDLFSEPPQYATSMTVQAQHAYPETRFTGSGEISSGNGTRVNISAPADNVISFEHTTNGADDAVTVVLNGGTSASAPQTAAAAAIMLQLARLTGRPFANAASVRTFLEKTATALPPNGQADAALNVGPQIDVRRGVEALLTAAGSAGTPAVHRVAVEQRRNNGDFDGSFQSDTDPGNIDLQSNDNANILDWITIAPDWEWMPAGTTYSLSLMNNTRKVLATTPWARLLPTSILTAAGLPLSSTSARTVKLHYRAFNGKKLIAQIPVTLTFSPSGDTTISALAPKVPLVVTGKTIPVTYDISHVDNVSSPELVVSFPGRFNPSYFGPFNFLKYPLTALSGTIHVPVGALQGGGIYGIGVEYNTTTNAATDFAFVRVAPPSASPLKPLPPSLSAIDSAPLHDLEIPYGSPFDVHWNVRTVPGADGAIVEISAPGPSLSGIYNPFNNPEGSIVDHNGIDTGSVYSVTVSGTAGVLRVNPKTAGLSPTFQHTVRVIPLKSGAPAGEASDVSTVKEDGVSAADGGFVYPGGFGVNANGNDGYLTSWQFSGTSNILSSLETLQTTKYQVTGTVASQLTAMCCSAPSLLYRAFGPGVFGNDIGLYYVFDQSGNTSTYGLLNPIATGTLGQTWSPSVPTNFQLTDAAWNQTNTTGAFFGLVPALGRGRPTWDLFTSDLSANTTGSTYDITSAISSESSPAYQAIAENPATNQAWLVSLDGFSQCGTPMLVDVDLGTGNTSSFTGVGSGTPEGIVIDPSTNTAAVTTGCDGGLGIYNLTAKTGTNVILPGGETGFYLAADPVNHLILMAQMIPADSLTNANALSHLLVYDENGNLVENKSGFQWYTLGIYANVNGLQVVPSQRTGLTFSPDQTQLEPFTY